jgi:hypothetical protein
MTKYTLAKDKSDGYGGNIPDIKIVNKKSELRNCLNNGWYEVDRFTPIITPIKKWWNNFTTNQKIAILSFIISSSVALIFGIVAYKSDKENDSLKIQNTTLNENYNQSKRNLILTSDSLSLERENSEKLLQQLKTKITSDKK